MDPQIWKFEPYRRIGQLIIYYFLAAPWPYNPTFRDYQNWLNTLPQEARLFYGELGFKYCQTVNAFRRFWLEERDYYLKDYLRMHLFPQEYKMYEQMERYGSIYPACKKRLLRSREDRFLVANLTR